MTTTDTTAATPAATFGSFTITRVLKARPPRVYAAFATPEGKQKWFTAPAGEWEQVERSMDFRVGGKERLVGKWKSGMVTDFDCTYRDIVPGERIVYVYDMVLNGKKISVSLATIEIRAEGEGSRLTMTEQDVFVNGFEDGGGRERGTTKQMEMLEASLQD